MKHNNFFVKLFGVSLDNIKINFYRVQNCYSYEIFVQLKRVGEAYQIN